MVFSRNFSLQGKLSFFSKPPVLLSLLIGITILGGPYVPLAVKEFFYGISLTLKSLIIFLLPVVIFSLLFRTILQLSGKATKILLVILSGVCLSNLFNTLWVFKVGHWIYSFDLALMTPASLIVSSSGNLSPLWTLNFPSLVPNHYALLSALLLGSMGSYIKSPELVRVSDWLFLYTQKILNLVTYIIPPFILGFMMKFQHDGVIQGILSDYSRIFLLIGLTQVAYISFQYLLVSGGNFYLSVKRLQHMLPPAISAFTTMSSAATLPLTIKATQKNLKNPLVADALIPTTVNIHLVGDCLAIPVLAFATLKSYGMAEPSFIQYLIFSLYFVVAKFSVAAIPGGGIIVMSPYLETFLGFNSEMISLITALYILFDPFITCTNVLGNGAFAQIMERYFPSSASFVNQRKKAS